MDNEQRNGVNSIGNSFPKFQAMSSQLVEENYLSQPTDALKNQTDSKKQASLYVVIRSRPLLKHEIKANLYEILRIIDQKVTYLDTFSLSFYLILLM